MRASMCRCVHFFLGVKRNQHKSNHDNQKWRNYERILRIIAARAMPACINTKAEMPIVQNLLTLGLANFTTALEQNKSTQTAHRATSAGKQIAAATTRNAYHISEAELHQRQSAPRTCRSEASRLLPSLSTRHSHARPTEPA